MTDRRAFLTILGKRRRITIGDDLLIGRDTECGLRLTKDPKVSRKHCRISQPLSATGRPDGFLLIDLESQNGLLVNSAKIHKCILQPGDIIRIGDTELRFALAPVSKMGWLIPTRPIYASIIVVLFCALIAVFALFGLDPAREHWGIAHKLEDALGDSIYRTSSLPPSNREPVFLPREEKKEMRKPSVARPAGNRENPRGDDFEELVQQAIASLRQDVKDALAAGEIDRAKKAVVAHRNSPLGPYRAEEIWKLEEAIAEVERSIEDRRRRSAAELERRFATASAESQQCAERYDFLSAKKAYEPLLAIPELADRARGALKGIEEREEFTLKTLFPARRALHAELILSIQKTLSPSRDFAQTIKFVGEEERNPQYKDHQEVIAKEKSTLIKASALYDKVVAAVMKIPLPRNVSLRLKDGKTMEGKLIAVADGHLSISTAQSVILNPSLPQIHIDSLLGSLSYLALAGNLPQQDNPAILRLLLYDGDFEGFRARLAGMWESDLPEGEEGLAFMELLGLADAVESAIALEELPTVERDIRKALADKNLSGAERIFEQFASRYRDGPALEDPRVKEKVDGLDKEVSSALYGDAEEEVKIVRDPTASVESKLSALDILKLRGAVRYLGEGLKDSSIGIRIQTVKYLGELRGETAILLLLSVIDDPQYEVGSACAEAIKRMALSDPKLIDRLKSLATQPTSPHRRGAVIALGGMGEKEKVIDTLKRALSDPDPSVRKSAIVALARIGAKEESSSTLAGMLEKEKDADVIAKLIAVLGYFQAKSSAPKVLSLLEKEPIRLSSCRVAAIRAVGEMQNPAVADRLMEFLKTEDRWQRNAVANALLEIGEPVKAKDLAPILVDPFDLNRQAGVMLLSVGNNRENIERLILMLEDESEKVRGLAVRMLLSRREKEVAKLIVETLGKFSDSGFAEAERVLEAMTARRFDGARPDLLKAWKKWLKEEYPKFQMTKPK